MTSTPTTLPKTKTQPYQPVLVACFSLSAGIVADRYIHAPLSITVPLTSLTLLGWIVARCRFERLTCFFLLLLFASLGASWHHFRWNVFPVNDIARYSTEDPRPICLRAIVQNQPVRLPPPLPSPLKINNLGEATRINIRIVSARNGTCWEEISGQADLLVGGQLLDLKAGDTIEAFGKLSVPEKATNPGEFDFHQRARSQRRLARLFASHPAAVKTIRSRPAFTIQGPINLLRKQLDVLLWRHIDHQHAPLASAILLGNRSQIAYEQRQDFMQTGTVHLLAISGLHVGILALIFLYLGRVGLLPWSWSLIATILFVILYAWLVEFRPPVTRAAILITLMCISKLVGRQALSMNSLSLSALIVLAINPTDLFQTGAQLSFLAVATIVVCQQCFFKPESDDPLDMLIARTRPFYERCFRGLAKGSWRLFAISFAIWIVTAPLVASRFHIVAPIGIVLNPLLMIPIWVALTSGFSVLISGWFLPPLATACGYVCNLNLLFISTATDWSKPIPGSHLWLAGPGDFWLAIFYGGLLLTFVLFSHTVKLKWVWTSLCCWYALTLILPNFPNVEPARWIVRKDIVSKVAQAEVGILNQDTAAEFRCTAIDVGHGTGILLEYPNGTTLLYDAGCISSPEAATRKVASVLWSKQIDHLDGIIVSHADADHYNGIPGILERFSVSQVFVSEMMFKRETRGLKFLKEKIVESGAELKIIRGGDVLNCDRCCETRILHPYHDHPDFTDNGRSIVLSVEAFDHKLLLPGDLETDGMLQFLTAPPTDCDVVMAPHHGSAGGEHLEFAAWSTPEYVIVSSSDHQIAEKVIEAYRDANVKLFATSQGATEFIFRPQSIMVQRWVNDRWEELNDDH